MRFLIIPIESGGGGCAGGCGCLVLLVIIGAIGSCIDKFFVEPERRAAWVATQQAEKERDDEKIRSAASVGAVDLDVELKQSGFPLNRIGSNGLKDLTQFGNVQLKNDLQRATDELPRAEEDYKRANAINQPDIQPRISEAQAKIRKIQSQIEAAQTKIAQTKYIRRGYEYSTLNEQRDGNKSSCTIRIHTIINGGFANTKVSFSVPDVTLVGKMENRGSYRDTYIEFFVSGSTESLKELVNNTNSYKATMLFQNTRYNSNRDSVEADILEISIGKAQ